MIDDAPATVAEFYDRYGRPPRGIADYALIKHGHLCRRRQITRTTLLVGLALVVCVSFAATIHDWLIGGGR